MPNGVYFQKTGFVKECELNTQKFQIPVAGNLIKNGIISESETSICSKAIIVLPNDVLIEEQQIYEWLKNEFTDMIYGEWGFSIGNFFHGMYRTFFDKCSLCIAYQMNLRQVIFFTQRFLPHFNIESALIKDLERQLIFSMTLTD